jgi:hypothetical protein
MSRKDQRWRKEREERKRKEKLAEEELKRKRIAAARNLPDVLIQVKGLFEHNAGRALKMAFLEKLTEAEIADALGVDVEYVDKLFAMTSESSPQIVRILERWPQAFENPQVLEAVIEGVKRGGYANLFPQ